MAAPAASVLPAAPQPVPTTGLYDDVSATIAGCADDACRAEGVAAHGDRLAAVMADLPTGLAGPHAWMEFAASQWGVAAQPLPVPDASLADALLDLYDANGILVDDELGARVEAQAAGQAAESAARAIAQLVSALAVAARQAGDSLAGLDPALSMEGLQHTWRLARTTPAAGDVAQFIFEALEPVDRQGLASAGLTVSLAVSEIQPVLWDICTSADLELPFIQIGALGDSAHDGPFLLLIDCTGNDAYTGGVGSGAPFGIGGVGLVFDVQGDDTYDADSNAQGAGVTSIGMLYDGGGADTYRLNGSGQGHGVAGIGLLYDAGEGADVYTSPDGTVAVSTKGSGLGGIGLLIDEGGNDVFHQDRTDGIGYAAFGGFSILASRGDGNDAFLSSGVPRFSPGLDELVPEELRDIVPPISGPTLETHVGPLQASSELTGATILYEEGGDDLYLCGGDVRQGCQGAASDLAVAYLLDRGGDDHYEVGTSVSTTLEAFYDLGRDFYNAVAGIPGLFVRVGIDATEAFCIIFVGVVTDPAPCSNFAQSAHDAERAMLEPFETFPEPPIGFDLPTFPMGQGAAYSLSVPVLGPGYALLRDEAGDDIYRAERWAQGFGTAGVGVLVDKAGTDTYDSPAPASGARGDGSTWQDGVGGYGRDE